MAKLFKRVEIRATLPDGREVHEWHSFPGGISLARYREMDRRAVIAYGPSTKTVGVLRSDWIRSARWSPYFQIPKSDKPRW